MTLLATEEYVEAGYLLDDDYVGGIASGEADTTTTYVEEGYIQGDYFRPGGGAFTIFADLTLAIEQGSATLNSSAGMTIVSTKIRSGSVVMSCSGSANISSNIIKGVSATFGAVALMGHDENGGFANDVVPAAVFDTGAQLDSTATMSTTAGKISQLDANISGAFVATMNVIATMSGDVLMQAAVSMSCDADKIADIGGLLEYFADLNAAAAATIGATATVNTNISMNISPDVILQGASEVVSTTLLQVFEPGVRPFVPFDTNLIGAFGSVQAAFGNNSSQTLDNNLYYIEYQESALVPNNTDEWVFETFVHFGSFGGGGNNSNEIITVGPSTASSNSHTIKLQQLRHNSQDVLLLTYYDSNDAGGVTYGTTDLDLGENHISVAYKPGTGIKIWLNGALEINESFTGDLRSITDPSVWFGFGGLETGNNSHFFYLDETRILQSSTAITDAGLTFANSSQTVPTQAYTNNPSTQLLLHYEGNYLDDDSGVKEYVATINSAASLTSDAARIVAASSNINSVSGLSSAVTRVRSADSTLASSTTATATGDRIKSGVATLASAFAVSSSGSRTRGMASNLSSSADLNSVVGIIHQGQVSVNAFVTTLTAAGRVGDYFVNADINSTFTTDAVVVRGGSSSINSEFDTTANANIFLGIGATINSAASLSSSLSTILGHTATINSAASLTSDAGKIHSGGADVDIAATLSCAGSRLTVEVANYGAQFDINVSGNTISDGAATTNTTASINANGGVLADGGATLTGFFAVLSVNKILHVDEFVYKIPAETREYKIINETRSFKISTETRSYKIKGAA